MSILTLLTDFGTADYYVAAVKGTVLRLAPGTQLVDVSHEVPAGDVATAAFLLSAAVPWFPEGTVHLAVVDPGVGSRRRILAVRTDSALLVLPDNGLLSLLPIRSIRSVERTDLFLPGPGQTFHGRDRFAPVAAWLLRGKPVEELGPEVDDPVRLPLEAPGHGPGRASGQVVHVDRYGNLITDIPAGWLPEGECSAEVAGRVVRLRAEHYAEIPEGEAALIPGSLGTVEISLRGDDLARRWTVERGAPVRITWAMS
ncbi:MAG TPA: SAM-dependent chlorinase/fluorinase [Thermoanaerobaculia bacterium]|nr:SAM-dependent chlorinase/fluorinase [Thermoanaerobaculia bacterium]